MRLFAASKTDRSGTEPFIAADTLPAVSLSPVNSTSCGASARTPVTDELQSYGDRLGELVADSDTVPDAANVFVCCDAERVLDAVKEGVADSDGVVEGGEPLAVLDGLPDCV
jgi:hypothetical protein